MREDLYAAAALSPFWASVLWRLHVARRRGLRAAVELDGYSVVVGDLYEAMPPRDRVVELLHVAAHVIFDHPGRRGDRDPELWWLAADAVSYSVVKGTGIPLPPRASALLELVERTTGLRPGEASVEEVYERLLLSGIKLRLSVVSVLSHGVYMGREGTGAQGGDGDRQRSPEWGEGEATRDMGTGDPGRRPQWESGTRHGDGGTPEESLETVNEGDPSIYLNAERRGPLRQALRQVLSTAIVSAKRAGYMALNLSGEYARLAEGQINWRTYLRTAVMRALFPTLETWARPNRRVEGAPGHMRRGINRVWCLVDTSGSISDEEYDQFMSEVAEIARRTGSRVVAVLWEVGVKAVHTVRRGEDVGRIRRVGFGGTVLAPALRYVRSKAQPGEPVVVFTDFVLWDREEAIGELAALARKHRVIIATTGLEPRVPGTTVVRIGEARTEEMAGMAG